MHRYILLFLPLITLISCVHLISPENESHKEISDLYIDRNYPEVITLASLYLKDNPDDLKVNHYMGRALMDINRGDESVEYLLKSIKIDKSSTWISSWSNLYLGVYYSNIGDLKNAAKYFNTTIELNKTRNSVNYAKKRLFLITDFKNVFEKETTESINFYFEKPENIINIDHYINSREEAFQKICADLEVDPNFEIDFYGWDSAKVVLKEYGIPLGFSISDEGIIHSAVNQTVGHEITHSIVYHIYNMTGITTGLINEGIAVYYDFNDNFKLIDRIKAYKKQNRDPVYIMDLWNNWRNHKQEMSYPVAGGFIEFLVAKEGINKLRGLLADQSYENGKNIYGEKLDSYIQEYEEIINSL